MPMFPSCRHKSFITDLNVCTVFINDFRITLVGPMGRSDSAPQDLSLGGECNEDQPPPMKKVCSEPAGGPLEDYTKFNTVKKPNKVN